MLLSLLREVESHLELCAGAFSGSPLAAPAARVLADRSSELFRRVAASREALAPIISGTPQTPSCAVENRAGERREAARGAEPRPLVLTHSVTIDFGAGSVLCDCGHTFPLRDSRELTHFVACPRCMSEARIQRVENLLRGAFYGPAGVPPLNGQRGPWARGGAA